MKLHLEHVGNIEKFFDNLFQALARRKTALLQDLDVAATLQRNEASKATANINNYVAAGRKSVESLIALSEFSLPTAVAAVKALADGNWKAQTVPDVTVDLDPSIVDQISSFGKVALGSDVGALPSPNSNYNAPDEVVINLAGSYDEGFVDGPLGSAKFNSPLGIVFSPTDTSLYVCDRHNNCIRKIDLQEGIVGTFVFIGKATFSPSHIVKYHKKNTFFTTSSNNQIHKVTSLGAVSVFAGSGEEGGADGDGTKASFCFPQGIAIDQRNGDLYISEFVGNKIRKITQQGRVSTIAGDGQARLADSSFHHPAGLCFSEKDDCLYIADRENHRIQKLNIKTGHIGCIAGNGRSGDADGEGTAAQFLYPRAVTYVDADGSLLVSEKRRIRRIRFQAGKAVVQTLRLFNSGFCVPYLCIDPSTATCYVSDNDNNMIKKFRLQ